MNFKALLIMIVLLAALGVIVYIQKTPESQAPTDQNGQPNEEPNEEPEDIMVNVYYPMPNDPVTSPLVVQGEARGGWYFEASFPMKLYDANGSLLAEAPAQALGDWMTTDFVTFSGTLVFPTPSTTTGTLVLEKDNPSGLPQNDDSISIPVNF